MRSTRPGAAFVLFGQSLFLLTASCGDPLEAARTGEVRGDLVLASETRLFRQCGSDERWWFVLDPFENGGTIPGWDAAMKATMARCSGGTPICDVTGVYLEGVARISPKGAYGHLRQYHRNIEFSSITRALGAPPDDCAVSPQRL